MTERSDHPDPERLLAHDRFVRNLAATLVRDPGRADDLAQQAWVAALTHRLPAHGLRAWLATLVRNLGHNARRDDERRERREKAAARPEAVPAVAEARARESARRELVDAVFALAEPYRSAVVLRYLDGLPPRAIAKSLGVPVETVRTRIKRALEQLRARLDGAHGGDRAQWALGLLPLARPAASGSITGGAAAALHGLAAGVLLMTTMTKVILGALCAAAVGLALWTAAPTTPAAAPGEPARAPAAAAPAAAEGTTSRAAPDPVHVREAATDVPPARAGARLATIRGRCVDEQGHPLAGCEARLWGTATQRSSLAWTAPEPVSTPADGKFEVRFTVPPAFYFNLALSREDRCPCGGGFHDLEPGRDVDLGDVVIPAAVRVRGRAVDTQGRPKAGVELSIDRLTVADDRPLVGPRGNLSMTSRADGSFGPSEPLAPGPVVLRCGSHRLDRGEVVELTLAATCPLHDIEVVVRDEEVPSICGIVVDEAGAPVGGIAMVRHLESAVSTTTRGDGTFELRPKTRAASGSCVLTVEAEGFEPGQSGPHELGARDVRVVLRRGRDLVVRVRDGRAGTPVGTYAVALFARSRHDAHRLLQKLPAAARPDGVARFPGIVRGDYVVQVDPGAGPLAASGFEPVTIGAGLPAEMTVDLNAATERTVRLLDAQGTAIPAANVELLDAWGLDLRLDTEAFAMAEWGKLHGLPAALLLQRGVSDAAGELRLRGPAGRELALRAGGPGIALQTLAPLRLDGEGVLELRLRRAATWTGRLVPADVVAELHAAAQPKPNVVARRGAFGIELWRDPDGMKLHRFFEQPVHCDAGGKFRIEGIPEGTWQVTVQALGGQFDLDAVGVREGQTLARDIDVSGLKLCDVELQVLVNGTPFPSRPVEVYGIHALGRSGVTRRQSSHQTDADGRVRLRTFAGQLAIAVSVPVAGVPRNLETPPVPVAAGAPNVHVIDVRPATLCLKVLLADGRAASGVTLRLAGPLPIELPPTDASGRTEPTPLASGSYVLQARPKSLGDDAGRAAFAQLYGWNAVHDAWVELGRIEVKPGTDPSEVEARLPPDWSK